MYSLEQLKKHKCTAEDIKPLAMNVEAHPKFKKCIERVAARIQDGVDRNLRDYKLWWALDKAYDAPFYQVSFQLLSDMMEKGYDEERVNSLVTEYGLTHLLEPMINADGTPCCGSDGKQKKSINIPVFTQVLVPLCRAYDAVRWAKIFNDRNQWPLYKYDPAYWTKANRLRCDLWTSRVSVMASQYGYLNDEKQAIFQTLHYGICLKFIRESWHREQQINKDGKAETVKEGLRFHLPTPDRMYYDLNDRPSTLNSDSGCTYAGYWHIMRYGELRDNPDFWNTDKVTFGGDVDLISKSPNFFATIYPCALKFPTTGSTGMPGDEGNVRDTSLNLYTSAEDDAAVWLNPHFERMIPKDNGIGDYEHPVWFRFVMANKNTPVFIEPISCPPAAYYGYDPDNNRRLNSSLTLELLPWQQHMGNILSQWIYSAKQNLGNPIFVDRDVVPKQALDALKNNGEKNLRGRLWIDFSSQELKAALNDKREAFYSPNLPLHNTSELRALMSGLLEILERTLQFSPQETGQAASHEQSATESNIIHTNVGNRVQFTASGIDDGIWATKKMIYLASVANADDTIYAQISPNYADTFDEFKKLCKELKIEIKDKDAKFTDGIMVSAKKEDMLIDAFASPRDADQRPNMPGMAAAAAQVMNSIATNPILINAVGPGQLIEFTNEICVLLGLPKNFKFKFTPQKGTNPEDQQAQMQQELQAFAKQVADRIEQGEKSAAEAIQKGDQQVAQATMQASEQQVQQLAEPVIAKIKELEQGMVQMAQMMQTIQQPPPTPIPVPLDMQGMAPVPLPV